MRYVIVLVIAAACAGTRAATPVTPSEAARAEREPPASRDELVRATFDALGKHDARALARLADLDIAMTRATTCTKPQDHHFDGRSAGERFAPVFEHFANARVEVIAVAKDDVAQTISPGEAVSAECKTSVAVEVHRLELDVRVTKGVDVRTQKAAFTAIDVGGAWYLEDAPRLRGDTHQQLVDFKARICACTDMACVEQAAKDAQEHLAKEDFSNPSDADIKIAKEIGDCVQKLAGSAAPP